MGIDPCRRFINLSNWIFAYSGFIYLIHKVLLVRCCVCSFFSTIMVSSFLSGFFLQIIKLFLLFFEFSF